MRLIFFCFGLLFFLNGCAQDTIKDTTPLKNPTWLSISDGLSMIELDAPKKSILGDSKITVIKIDPKYFDFNLLTATEHGIPLTAKEWADTFQMNIVFNASMYELTKPLISRAFLKNFNHHNNSEVNPNYNAMIAMNPLDTNKHNECAILDLKCEPWDNVKTNYHCYAQGMRMIDCNGGPMDWNKKKQSCSMLVAAVDPYNNFYLIFSRSPYTHNEMITFMQKMPYELSNAIYLEGGPETSIYMKFGDLEIKKVGSYVSQTYPNDDNLDFWRLPNVIGLKKK